MHYVTVLYHILFSLSGEAAGRTYGRLCFIFHIVLELDHFRADESFLEVRMDHSCGLGGLVSLADGPGAALVGAGGEECLEAEQLVRALDQAHYA